MIREMRKADLERCAEILEGAYSSEPYNEKFLPESAYAYVAGKFKSCSDHSFVICDEAGVQGFIFWSVSYWSDGPQAVLEEIVVSPDTQGGGLGSKLMNHSFEYLKKLKVKSAMLWALRDPRVTGFHAKGGFEISGEHCVMFKNLDI